MTPSHAKAGGDALTASLEHGRLENAEQMNRIRVLLATSMVALYLVALFGLREPVFRHTAPHLLVYWTGALGLWLLARRWRPALRASRFAVPLIDLPMAAWIQRTNATHAGDGQTTALFTLALCVFLIALSAFSLRPRHLLLTWASATVGLLTVYQAADLSPFSWIAGPVLLALTAGMMIWFPRRQAALIRDNAERQARRDRLARYFSPGVAEVIESHDDPGAGESCDLTVLFCDIRGFTGLSETLEASAVVRLLNDFHTAMVEEIFERGGTLDKYLGDGLLAYFNAPVRQADHALLAVQCALAMVRRLESLNEERATRGEPPLAIGIGLHSGQAVVGNVGAPHRREFTAIGDTVNVASRLQSLTRDRGVPVLVSESVARAIQATPGSPVRLRAAGETAVRGRTAPIQLFIPEERAA